MSSALVHSAVVDTLQTNVNVSEEEEVIDYICEILEDQTLQFNAVVDALSPLLISLHAATNSYEAAKVIRAITLKLAPEKVEVEEEQEAPAPKMYVPPLPPNKANNKHSTNMHYIQS